MVKTSDKFGTRMYQTIRVIRPQPQQPTPASILRDMPNGNLLVFAVIAGVGGSSLFYMLSKPGTVYILEQQALNACCLFC